MTEKAKFPAGTEIPDGHEVKRNGVVVAIWCKKCKRFLKGKSMHTAATQAAQWLALPHIWGLTTPEGDVGGHHAGYRIYPCADGRVAVAALEPHFAAALCTAAGLALMVWADLAHVTLGDAASGQYGWGMALAVLSMVSWTAFALLNARWVKAHPEVDSAQWTNWLGVATGLGALLLWLALSASRFVQALPSWRIRPDQVKPGCC